MGNIASREKRAVTCGGVSAGPPAKRPKIDDAEVQESGTARNDIGGEETAPPSLPPEVWAAALNYLDFQSVLSCAAASRSMLREVMPLVTALHIDRTSEMNATLAGRFRDVRNINLFSLIKEEVADMGYMVDHDAVVRVVPFLSCFRSLEWVFMGGKRLNGDVVGFRSEGDYLHNDDDARAARSLIDSMSGFFQFRGRLADRIRVAGLRCPNCENESGEDEELSTCDACHRACESFPLQSVLSFDNRGSSATMNSSFKRHYASLNVCLSRPEIESILENRPGGSALLQSDARFLQLLGQGRRYEIRVDGNPLIIVEYSKRDRKEIERAIQYADLDIKIIARDAVTEAIRRSFTNAGCEQAPPKIDCLLSSTSLRFLKNLGHDVRKDFVDPAAANVLNLPSIFQAMSGDGHFAKLESAWLLKKMIKDHKCIRKSCMDILSRRLQAKDDKMPSDACKVISAISNMSGVHAAAVVEAGLYQKLLRLLERPSRNVQMLAVTAIENLLDNAHLRCSFAFDFSKGAISGLLSCLSSPVDGAVASAGRSLAFIVHARTTKEQAGALIAEGFIRSFCSVPLKILSVKYHLAVLSLIAADERFDLNEIDIQLMERKLKSIGCEMERIRGSAQNVKLKLLASTVAATLHKRRNGESVSDKFDEATEADLKCPITGMIFFDPMKNRVCGHTYERAGLKQQLHNNKHTCPVPGCTNTTVSLAQMEEDEGMKSKVKRHVMWKEVEKICLRG